MIETIPHFLVWDFKVAISCVPTRDGGIEDDTYSRGGRSKDEATNIRIGISSRAR